MAVDLKIWWRKWWFGVALAGLMIACEVAMLVMALGQTPPGMRWLGNLVFNATDYPYYLSYLKQGAASLLVKNLYNDLGPIVRFEPFWSTGGLLVRMGLPPIAAHEILRWIGTLFLGLAFFAVTRDLYTDTKRSRIACLIAASGLGTGWLFAISAHLAQQKILVPIPPDVSSEFGLLPILFGGAHMIYSLALQFLIARWTWLLLGQGDKKYLWPDLAVVFLLASFHPYYIPLIGLMAVICFTAGRLTGKVRPRFIWFLGICLCLLPSTLYNFWLTMQDATLGNLYLQANHLPLAGWMFWTMSLSAIIIAGLFMVFKRVPKDYHWSVKPNWAWVWLLSAILCLFLPVPWTAKYTQGLLSVLAILTLPFWLWLWEISLIRLRRFESVVVALGAVMLSGPLLYYFFLASLIAKPEVRTLFYQPEAVFAAWRYLETDAPSEAVIISSDMDANLWTPTYASRPVWVAHEHLTPDFDRRTTGLADWRISDDARLFNAMLTENHIEYILSLDRKEEQRYAALLNADWKSVFGQDEVTLYAKQ